MTTIMQKGIKGIDPVFQTQGANTTSNKYGFISSAGIKEFFESRGFILDGVSYSKTKNPDKQGFQKHLMLFSRPDLLIDENNKLQILVSNAHDASQSLRLNAGVYRALCANGLVSGDEIFERRVTHKGNFVEHLAHELEFIVANISKLKEQVLAMKKYRPTFEETQKFIESMVGLRLQEVENIVSVDLSTVDAVRREADQGQDLYTVFNRVQESLIRGGIKYKINTPVLDENKNQIVVDEIAQYKERNATTRKLKDFTKTTELNKALWNGALDLVA